MILIGGEQKNQAVKTDGICTCLAASMGMGGGYVPMIIFQEEEKEERERCQFVTVFEIRRDEGGGKNLE